MDKKYIVTLELSGTQIRGAVTSVTKHPDGTTSIPTVEAIVTEDCEESVQYGRVQNLITAGNITKDVLRRLEDEFVSDKGSINGAYVAIGGRSLGSEHTTAEIALPHEMVVSQDILKNLYIEAAKNVSQNKKALKVLPRKFYVDNQTIQMPVGVIGSKLRGDFTLVTCNPINQRNLDLILSDKERVNLPVKDYVITQLALADMTLNEDEKQVGCVLVDLGHQTTTISIYKDRALQYMVTLPMGSQNITRDISMGMNVTVEKAESDKCLVGDALGNETARDEIGRINNFVGARSYEIVANINANIGYAKYKATDLPRGIVLAGRGARLKNFDTLLSNITNLPVRHASLPSNIKFGFNTYNIHPEDFMSMIAVILRICRNHEIQSCIDLTNIVPVTEVVEEKAPVRTAPRVTQPQPPTTTPQPTRTREINEDDWANDDPETDEEEVVNTKKEVKEEKVPERGPRKKPDRNWLDKLRRTVTNIVSADAMEDDADIDE